MIFNKHYILNLTLLSSLFLSTLFSQTINYKLQAIGYPFIKYYSSKEYKSDNTNWCIVQDKRGVMYFGNEKCILEFDGNSWRRIEVPNSALVRSLAIDDNGIIYVCASSDFGYLEPDSLGQLKYKSLVGYLDKKYKQSVEIWDVIANSKGVYFKTDDKIFRWSKKKFTVIDSVYSFRFYKMGDDIYARNNGTGLMKIEGDSVFVMPGGEYFKKIGVFDMLPYDGKYSNQFNSGEKKILVTTNFNGLFLHDGKNFSPFKTEVDSFFINNQIYNACITADGNFAFATQRGGVVIMDRKGYLLKIINEEAGLPTNIVYDVYSDRQGGLWLATANGIVHCEYPSSFSIIPDQGLIKDRISSMLRFKNIFYAVNSLGILYLDKGSTAFKLVKGSNKPGMSLLDVNGILLAATNWGVGIVENYNLKEMLTANSSNILLHSKFYPDRIYVGHRTGVTILQQQKNKSKFDVYPIDIDEQEISSVVEEAENSLWLLSDFGVLLHITDKLKNLSSEKTAKIKFDRFTKENGLPGNSWRVYNINGKMLLVTDKGVFRFNNESKSFVHDSTFGESFSNSTHIISIIEKNRNGDLWILAEANGSKEFGKAVLQKNDRYIWQPVPEFRRLELGTVEAIYFDYEAASNKEVLWLSTDEGLVRYDPDIHKNVESKYSTLIRKVVANNDSLIYGGSVFEDSSAKEIVLPFSDNNIRFEFSAASYDKPETMLYQYYLEGNDGNWSKWTFESKKEYTNLAQGDYHFRVRSKNVYGVISKEADFIFSVLPPWYLSWWAYVVYAILTMLGIYFTDRIMSSRLIIKERDRAKLREAELIKKQAEELETVDKLVRVINNAEDLETLFNSLLEQTIVFIPQAEKAAVFLLDHKDNLFHVAFTSGYEVSNLGKINFLPEELKRRYTENSDEIEKGIYIISNTINLFGDEKLSGFSKAKSMLVMAVEWDNNLEAYVVFDSFADKNAFNRSTARILNRFREHAVSAISKAQTLKTLQRKNEEIIKTQEQLVTQQKLASLGALTAGIAHEIKNPLNFVNNFTELSSELIDELAEAMNNEKNKISEENFLVMNELITDLKENFKKISNHGNRADSIIKGMLLHSRGSQGEKSLTNLNELLDQYVNLAYHGLRAQDKGFNITIEKDYDTTIEKINIIPQDISRVFLNVINNACYAANDKKRKNSADFSPVLRISTKNFKEKIEIHIRDNGNGIPISVREKIFNPFFTTKPAGEGTGLGLSISYDIIVKEHAGELKFDSKIGEYTEFIITIPK